MESRKLFSYDTLVHATSGAAGGVTAMVVLFPLDTVRTRLQVEEGCEAKNTFVMLKDIAQEEGIQGLYRGVGPVLASLCCSNLVYFYTFHGLRSALVSNSVGSRTICDLAVGAIAGVVNVLITTPLWVANSRIKFQGVKLSGQEKKNTVRQPSYSGIIDALIKIYKNEGWKALWSSLVPSLILVVNPTIQFTVYEALKSEAMKVLQTKGLNALSVFLISAISKSIATILTYPLQLIQSKLRYGSEEFKKMNLIKALIYILRIHGVRGLFKGLETTLYQRVFTASLMFLCYEKISEFVFNILHMSAKSASTGKGEPCERSIRISFFHIIFVFQQSAVDAPIEYRNSIPASVAQQQKLRVCEVCSSYLGIYDNDRRLADHFNGKLHLGFITIREKVKELEEIVEQKQIGRILDKEFRYARRESSYSENDANSKGSSSPKHSHSRQHHNSSESSSSKHSRDYSHSRHRHRSRSRSRENDYYEKKSKRSRR